MLHDWNWNQLWECMSDVLCPVSDRCSCTALCLCVTSPLLAPVFSHATGNVSQPSPPVLPFEKGPQKWCTKCLFFKGYEVCFVWSRHGLHVGLKLQSTIAWSSLLHWADVALILNSAMIYFYSSVFVQSVSWLSACLLQGGRCQHIRRLGT